MSFIEVLCQKDLRKVKEYSNDLYSYCLEHIFEFWPIEKIQNVKFPFTTKILHLDLDVEYDLNFVNLTGEKITVHSLRKLYKNYTKLDNIEFSPVHKSIVFVDTHYKINFGGDSSTSPEVLQMLKKEYIRGSLKDSNFSHKKNEEMMKIFGTSKIKAFDRKSAEIAQRYCLTNNLYFQYYTSNWEDYMLYSRSLIGYHDLEVNCPDEKSLDCFLEILSRPSCRAPHYVKFITKHQDLVDKFEDGFFPKWTNYSSKIDELLEIRRKRKETGRKMTKKEKKLKYEYFQYNIKYWNVSTDNESYYDELLENKVRMDYVCRKGLIFIAKKEKLNNCCFDKVKIDDLLYLKEEGFKSTHLDWHIKCLKDCENDS